MLTCPRCGQGNPEGARFCNACATPLAEPGAGRKERKVATALFADLVGSTALAERHDAEVVESVVGRTFELLAEEIKGHGGFLEKFMGDAVLAVFGIPTAHEDDPERAVRTALRVQEALPDLNRGLAAEGKPQLAVRIGIEAGEVLVDLERVAGPRDRMVTGDAINTAARLQQAAEPGGIVVGPNVHAATEAIVDYVPLTMLTLKGKAEPVPAWSPERVRRDRPSVRSPMGLEARLVGRDEQLASLKQAFHRVESEQRAGLATVLGAAGVGKSRLALELMRYLEGLPNGISWRKGRCLAYGNLSYSALAEAVKAHCRILEDDPPDVVAAKTGRAVTDAFGDQQLGPQIEALVGSAHERGFTREQLFDAWRRFLERTADAAPLVLVLEDIHWADDGLLDFVEYLADRARGRLFVLALARPELLDRRPGWGRDPNHVTVQLDPLTPEETEQMVQDLLPARLPEHLTRLVVERSEGNPLFGEEIVRMFIDRGVLRATEDGAGWEVAPMEEIEIPRSVQALIAARLDALRQDEKEVLQDAAVVGRAFWSGAAERLSGHAASEVRDLLRRLQGKQLVHPREPSTFAGESEFAFRHVLIRDVAYESLPKSLRADKHVDVARWAEEHAARRQEEIAELLATHYVQALTYLNELGEQNGRRGHVERAAYRWSHAAGERSLRLWQQREAVRWFRTALDLADRLRIETRAAAALWESYADACQGVEPYAEVEAALGRTLALYEEQGSPTDLGRVEARLAFVAYQSGQEEAVVERVERALARLEPLGDSADLALALSILGQYHRRRGQWQQAEQQLRRAMEMAERVGDRVAQGRAMVWLGSVLQGAEGERGTSLLRDALEFARDVGDLSLILRALLELSEALEQATGEYREAEALLREGIELARNAGNIGEAAWMEGNLADYLLDLGRLDNEVELLARNGLAAARELGETTRIGYSLAAVTLIHAQRGELDEAQRALEELREIIVGCPDPYMEGWHALAAGLLAQARGQEDDAAEILAATARELGDRIQVWGGQNLLCEAIRCLARQGRPGETVEFVDRLRTMSERSVPAAAFLAWAEGLLATDLAERRARLVDAGRRFEALGRRIEVGRCLVELGDAERRLGEDPGPTLSRAREALEECGAALFLAELDATQASEPPLRSA